MTKTTKRVLADNLKIMMTQQPLAHITIDALTKRAHVNRNTFYYHFEDIYQLLEWTFDQEIVTQIQTNLSAANWQEKYQQMLTYVQDNRDFCLAAANSVGRHFLENFLYSVGVLVVRPVVKDIDDHLAPAVADAIVDFYAGTLAAQLLRWLDDQLRETEAQMLARAKLMLQGTIELIVQKSLHENDSATDH